MFQLSQIAGSIFATNMGAPTMIGLAGSGASVGIAPVMFEWHVSIISTRRSSHALYPLSSALSCHAPGISTILSCIIDLMMSD